MSDLEETQKRLEETRRLVAELSAKMNEVQSHKESVQHEILEERKRLNKLESKRLEFDNAAAEIRRELRSLSESVILHEKELSKAQEAERVRKEFNKLTSEFDELIATLPWGTRALPHQIEGAKKLAIAHRAILGDKRGLGKTLTSIAATDLLGAKKILAIVPAELLQNFLRELHFWAPHRPSIVVGGLPKIQRKTLLEFYSKQPESFVIVNYEAWRKDNALLDQLVAFKFDTVIADEAHMIKEMATNAYRGVKQIVHAENACKQCGSSNFGTYQHTKMMCYNCDFITENWGDFCSVRNFFPMTGTPWLNKPQDIFPLLHLINPRLFGDQKSFLNAYCILGYDNKWRFRPGGEERLASKISAYYIGRNRDQAGVKIPKQSEQIHNLELDASLYPQQWEAYQILKERSAMIMDDMLADEENKGVVPVLWKIALITRQRQMMVWPAGIKMRDPKTKEILFQSEVTESVKVDYATSLIKDLVLDEQERVVLFSQFKGPLEELEKRLEKEGIRAVRYDGDTPDSVRQEIQIDFDRKFQAQDNPPKWDVALCNYKSGGVGLNLNAATQTIILDEEWNPGKVDQAYGRTDRMGQTNETTVHVLRVKETIDSWLANLIQSKAEMIQGVEGQLDMEQELLDILRGIKPKGVE